MKKLLKYILFIVSLLLAVLLIEGAIFQKVIDLFLPFEILTSLLAGILFTFFLTAPMGSVLFYILGEAGNPFIIALVGGLGAMFGDLILIHFFRDSFLDFEEFSKIDKNATFKKIKLFFKASHFRSWIFPVLGAFIIASPLPDELGLLMLSTSNLKLSQIGFLSYILNTLGILLIALIPKLIQGFS